MSNKYFYKAFEDKHRGSRELIKKRLSVYLPFILPLKNLYPNLKALDVGCGRGEWLELLNENNISAKGIDLNEGMIEKCKVLNFDVVQGDGISYLKEIGDESLTVISAFHVVEHISFEDLQNLVRESLRVLKPGGILIMETPNPENIKVATENFYIDPTHIKPIPSALLSFLPEFYGYTRTKVLRLQESKELANQESINLLQVIEGVSQDYAVIAQKEATEDILKNFDEVFAKDFGLSLKSLATKFENRLLNIEAKVSRVEEKINRIEMENKNQELIQTLKEQNQIKEELEREVEELNQIVKKERADKVEIESKNQELTQTLKEQNQIKEELEKEVEELNQIVKKERADKVEIENKNNAIKSLLSKIEE